MKPGLFLSYLSYFLLPSVPKAKNQAPIMVWNQHDEDKQEAAEEINIIIDGLATKTISLIEYRIGNEHSNSYEV